MELALLTADPDAVAGKANIAGHFLGAQHLISDKLSMMTIGTKGDPPATHEIVTLQNRGTGKGGGAASVAGGVDFQRHPRTDDSLQHSVNFLGIVLIA